MITVEKYFEENKYIEIGYIFYFPLYSETYTYTTVKRDNSIYSILSAVDDSKINLITLKESDAKGLTYRKGTRIGPAVEISGDFGRITKSEIYELFKNAEINMKECYIIEDNDIKIDILHKSKENKEKINRFQIMDI